MSLETAKRVLRVESEAIAGLIERLDTRFEKAVELLHACKGRVVVTGLGKSGLVGRKIAATFASTGTPALFLHTGEALHGDLGMLTAGDVMLAISTSGETAELIELLETVKRLARSAAGAHCQSEIHAGPSQQHRPRHRRKRRSLLAESSPHSIHSRSHGHGRRSSHRPPGTPRLQSRRFRRPPSRRPPRKQTPPRRIPNAPRRECAPASGPPRKCPT